MNGSKVISCPLCDKLAQLKFSDHVGYQNSYSYDIYHCDACSTAFANPLKVESEIYNHIYSNIENVLGYNRYFLYSNQVLKEKDPLNFLAQSEDMYWSIQQFLKKKNNKALRILEIGCGLGYLTYAIARAGYTIQGMDISQVAIEQATERYGELFFCADLIEFAKNAPPIYDVIIFTELIEHIPDVKGFLKAANALLKPGGNIVLTTPNKTPYPKDILWETEPPPVHLWWFSEKSIRVMGKMLGHRVSFINFCAYNRQEIRNTRDYTKPYTLIRDFQRSREPRLGPQGEVLKAAIYVIEPLPPPPKIVKPVVITPGRSRLKKILNFFGLLKPIQLTKVKYAEFIPVYELWKKHGDLSFDPNKKRRLTLCAIFKKPFV